MKCIGRAWRGEEPLWRVFWVYSLLVPIVSIFVFAALTLGVAIIAHAVFGPASPAPEIASSAAPYYSPSFVWWACFGGSLFSVLMVLPFSIWVNVSLWRCAFNSQSSFWGYLARIWVVIGVFTLGKQALGTRYLVHILTADKAELYQISCAVYMYNNAFDEKSHADEEDRQKYIVDHKDDFKTCVETLYKQDTSQKGLSQPESKALKK